VNDGPSITSTQQPDTTEATDEQIVDEMKQASDSTAQDDVTADIDDENEDSTDQDKAEQLPTESVDSNAQSGNSHVITHKHTQAILQLSGFCLRQPE